jgi:hypothetical protein
MKAATNGMKRHKTVFHKAELVENDGDYALLKKHEIAASDSARLELEMLGSEVQLEFCVLWCLNWIGDCWVIEK